LKKLSTGGRIKAETITTSMMSEEMEGTKAMQDRSDGEPSRPRDGRYARVSSCFWTDERARRWPDDAKFLALYLLTNPHRNLEGLYVLPIDYVVADLRWPRRRVLKAMAVLTRDGFLLADEATDVLLLRNALRYQAPANDSVREGALSRLRDLPKTPLFFEFVKLAKQHLARKDGQAQKFLQEVEHLAHQMEDHLEDHLGVQVGDQMVDIKDKSKTKREIKKETQPEMPTFSRSVERSENGGDGKGKVQQIVKGVAQNLSMK
jgi:hypothetical protein